MGYQETLAAFRRGDNATAARLAQLDLAQAEAAGDRTGTVDALCMLARVALREGRLHEVEARATEAQRVAADGGERKHERMAIHLRAVATRMAGRHDESRALYLQSIAINEELGEGRMAAVEHRNLAYLEIRAGDIARARELFAESRRRLAGADAGDLLPYLTLDEATLATLDGDYPTAAAKLAAADRQFAALGVVPDPDDAAELVELRRRLSENTEPR